MSHALYSNMPTPALLAADISAAATTITLQAGGAARLPTITAGNYIWATLFHITGVHGANTEIVKVTAVSGEDLTVTRGQQGTTAEAFYLGDKLEIRVTADGLEEFATLDGATFTGPVAADVTGDLTGNVTGDLVQPITAWTRATTTTLETTSNGTLSDTGATIGAFNGVAGVTYHIRILGAGTITNSAGLIITQGLADITTAAGDTCDVEMITATTSRVKNYVSSAPLVYARVQTANGYGSTNTKIRRFTTVLENTGIYVDSATLGAKFTIPVDGKYFIGYSDQFNVGSSFGVSLNSTQLTTSIHVITQADILMGSATSAGDYADTVGVCVNLLAGDVIRPHTAGAPSGASTWAESFIILRIA